jgi:hypothetical protein
MFVLRGVVVSFCIFFIMYAVLSLIVCFSWRSLAALIKNLPSGVRADWLFAVRMFPLAVSMGLTLFFAVPSFLMLEPRAVEEAMRIDLMISAFCGMALVLIGIGNAGMAWAQVSKTVAQWSTDSEAIARGSCDLSMQIPVLCASMAAPPLSIAGVLRPQVWLSHAANSALTDRELVIALRHEVVHARRYDNLKKLFLLTVAFPGMAGLEREWRGAGEIAADEAAVSSQSDALDLAAAVIKLSGLVPPRAPVQLATALVHSSAESLNDRVERLIAWKEPKQQNLPHRYGWFYAISSASAATVPIALTYGNLLVRVHAATEWLVR